MRRVYPHAPARGRRADDHVMRELVRARDAFDDHTGARSARVRAWVHVSRVRAYVINPVWETSMNVAH